MHSPSPIRSHSKRHSRSHSPRASRSAASPSYYGRSSRADSASFNARSPTPPTRKIDINDKITDTSLFAELVKDKRKRTKVLQEILDKKEEPTVISSGENSNSALNNNDLVAIDRVDGGPANTSTQNGVSKEDSARISLGDIPMPNATTDATKAEAGVATMGASTQPPLPQTLPSEPSANNVATSNDKKTGKAASGAIGMSSGAGTGATAVIPNDLAADSASKYSKASPAAITKKPKSLTKLPMPPGVNAAELEDITTPSPPRSSSPPAGGARQTRMNSFVPPGTKTTTPAGSVSKKGLLNLPMPPMVPGSEDLSGDDDYTSSPNPQNRSKSNSSMRREIKRKRPTILNRRDSRSLPVKDWGERCVDVFEVITQIGEGTYGQVRLTPRGQSRRRAA